MKKENLGLRGKGKLIVVLILILVSAGVACGYRFVGRETNLPPDIRSLAIPIFNNQTDQLGLESEVTRALLEKFIISKRLAVREQKLADVILSGRVKSFNITSVAVTKGFLVTSGYRATVTIEVMLKRQENGQILWKEEVSEAWNYPVGPDLTQTEINKKEAIRQIALLLAERVHEMVLGGF